MNIQLQSFSSHSCKSNQTVQSIKKLFSFTVKQVNSQTFVSINKLHSYTISHYTVQIISYEINSYEILNTVKYHMKQSQIMYIQLSHIKKAQIQTIQNLKAYTGVSFSRYTTIRFIRVPCYYRYSRDPHRSLSSSNSTSMVYTRTILLVQQPNQRLYDLSIYACYHTQYLLVRLRTQLFSTPSE